MLQSMISNIVNGLQRNTITKCSQWAEKYRISGMPYPGPWNFKHHPWTREMCNCTDEQVVGQKAAQMGYTEVALNRCFYALDTRGESILYVLPATNPDASDFSTSRFDPALEISPHLSNMFSDVKNIGHKRAGSANLYIRGSRSRSQLKSIPVAGIVLDEVDEMVQDNIPLALERTAGQPSFWVFKLSTPWIEGHGINVDFENSSQDHYFFPCPHCSKLIEFFDVEKDLIVTSDNHISEEVKGSHLVCQYCKGVLKHEEKIQYLNHERAGWVSAFTNRSVRGFYVNQMYSMSVKPYQLAISWLKAQSNPADEQEFYNSKMGLPRTVEGARITDADILNSTGQHKIVRGTKETQKMQSSLTTMGVDVGTYLHLEITEWTFRENAENINKMAQGRVIYIDKVKDFEQLDELMLLFNINFCVIDANPERRKALEFAQRFYGRVKLCFYSNGASGREISIHKEEECTIAIDRTAWLDQAFSRFRDNTLKIPADTPREYKEQLKEPVRVILKDGSGNPVARYPDTNKADHYAHARNYNEIALPFAAGIVNSHDITGVF